MPHYQSADGLNLYYEEAGEGLPVLALPGLTRNTTDFDHVAPHLPGVRLIRTDYRGRGRSDWGDYKTYTIPQESADVLGLMNHLGLEKAAILGTSRGGLIGMALAATVKDRLLGVALNDIGPAIDGGGMDAIKAYLGRNPPQKTYAEAAEARATLWPGFNNIPMERWLAEVKQHYDQTDNGLVIRYDPKLRDAVLETAALPTPDLWPLFDALNGLPIALTWGMNSDLLSAETVAEMSRRRPDMIRGDVPDRGHVPFQDEPQAVEALQAWLKAMQ